MAYTQEQHDALQVAIAEGVREVMYGDKRIIYRDLDEMKIILADMKRELGLSVRPQRKYPVFSKGLR